MNNFLSKNLIPIAVVIAGVLIAGAILFVNQGGKLGPAAVNPTLSPSPTVSSTPEVENSLDNFAECLTEKGAKFYGASWCGHCLNQKKMFGDAMKFVNYIECWDNKTNKMTDTCAAAKIEAFPTWDFPGGQREMGEIPLEKLSELSGCKLINE